MPTTVDLVCIGSGPAGQRAAVQAAKLGKSVVVIERRRCLGGVCVETGTIPSKTFREAVIHATAAPTLDRPRRDAARPTAPELLSRVNRGIEYASMFAALGVTVTLVDRRPRPLEFLDHEIVDELIHQMRDRNVTFRLEEAVKLLEVPNGEPRRVVTHLESGKQVVTDMAFFSVGRLGATA